ncbi:hypothetical protein DVH24_017862 [Malus domestica]|uniref:ABC transporter domain-containing protein n=1 Tax=Malus domestica TaxID=3750 RepID=A0A498KBV4_MALDO|nr:hypothetical protein DVH24_017862 [Malus domestica]
MWNSAENVFARSGSFREEGDDEEALRWAALERLPTYARVRRGIFRNVVGDTMEIDVSELEAKEQKLLLDRLVSSADDDPEQFFDRMRRRFDAVALNFPKIEVRFQNLKVEAFVHVGSRALPTIPNFVFNMAEIDITIGSTKLRKDHATFGSCRAPGNRFAGNVTYNGHGLSEFVPQRTSAYVSQQDWHVAEMTVRETLEFAGRCQGVGTKYDMLVELARREKCAGIIPDEDLDIFMKSLALGGKETSLVVEYIMKLLFVAMVTMSVFFRSTLHHNTIDDGGLYLGALYFSMVIILFNGFMEVSMLVAKLPVLYKHRDLHFYPSWVYTIPSWALSVPNSFIESGFWVAITYYVIGFDPSITRFCGQFLIYFLLHQMSIALFRLMGSLGRNMIVANTFGSFAMLVVMALGGYIISKDRIPKWWIWGFWFSPLMYAQNAASVNEFLGHKWDKRIGNETIPLGEALLKARSLFPQSYWFWIGAGALLGYTILFNVLFTFFLAYLNPLGKRQAVVTKEELQERERRRKGEAVVIELRQYLQHSESLNEEVMELVELTPLSGALVGLPGVDGLSTEQRKRLTIAVELVANPSIVFMDEPTSGLDARSAAIVMRTVRNIVNTGRTIVCTIHQPSIDIFESFDELLFLKRGGELIYAGPLGPKSCELIKYFEAVEGVEKIRPGYNPATWMLDVTSTVEESRLGVDFAEVYRRSNLFRHNKELVEILSKPSSNSKELNFPTKYSQSFVEQFLTCLWKQNLSYWRNPQYTAVRFFYTVIISLMDTQQDLLNAMGSMYAAILFSGITNATAVQPVVSVERFVSYRERAAGMYSALPFAFAQVVIELPYVFAQAIFYCTIFYSTASFEWTALKFLWYIFFMYFTMLYFTFYGMMTTAVTPNHNVAAVIAAPFYMLWNLFSGFMIPHKRIPIWWRWYYWANPVAWSLYGLFVSQYGEDDSLLTLADGIHKMPNGRFRIAVHRAVVNELHHRISIAYFHGQPMDVKISPLIDHNRPLYLR